MSGLSDEDKARIRREEEARLKALEEERYRAKVRAELEAELAARAGGEAPRGAASQRVHEGEAFVWTEAPPEPGTDVDRPALAPPVRPVSSAAAPAPAKPAPRAAEVVPVARAPRPPRVAPWWTLAALLLAGGGTLLVLGLSKGGGAGVGAGGRDRVDLALKASGPVAEIARPPWDPGQLATDEYRIDEAGRVTSVPGRGLDSFEAWRAAYQTPPPVMRELFPERPTLPEIEARGEERPPAEGAPRMLLRARDEGPGPSAGMGAALDDLMRVVPPQAWMVIGVARAGVARSPALVRAHAELARQLGAMSPLSAIGGRELLLGTERLVYAAVLDGVDAEEEFLVSAATADSGRVRDAALAAGATVNAGVFEWLALPSGEGVIVEAGRFAAARPRTTPSMIAARAGDSVGWAGELGPMLRRVSAASAIFGVVHTRNADPADMERALPGLGRVRVVGASVDVGEAITARLNLELGDMTEATNLLAAFERARAGVDPGSPQAGLIARITPSIEGAVLTLTLTLAEYELAALGREAGLTPP